MPVIQLDLTFRRPLADGRSFGSVGPYEELKGRLRFSIDPTHAVNASITDVERAPRNREGRVEFAADVSIPLPNFNHATRPVFGPGASDPHPPIDVGDGFLMHRGYTVVSCGWQCDVPELPGLFRLYAPEARGAEGRPLRGRVYVNLQAPEAVRHFLLSDRGHLAYPAAE